MHTKRTNKSDGLKRELLSKIKFSLPSNERQQARKARMSNPASFILTALCGEPARTDPKYRIKRI